MGTVLQMADESTPFSRAFGKRLRTIRKAEGYKKARQFAEVLGVEENTLTTWERGTRTPKLDMVLRICQVLRKEPNDLLIGRVVKERNPALSSPRVISQRKKSTG